MISFRLIVFVSILLSFSACTISDFQSNCADFQDDPSAMRLCKAENGDQQAQYELGKIAYDEKDIKTAIKWLELASQSRPSKIAIYVPPVNGKGTGRVMLNDTNYGSSGIRRAQLLLSYLYRYGIGVELDIKKAQKYQDMF